MEYFSRYFPVQAQISAVGLFQAALFDAVISWVIEAARGTDAQKWNLSLLWVLKWKPERLLSSAFPVPNTKCIIRRVTGFVAQYHAVGRV